MWPGAIVDGVASGVIGDIGDKSERPSIDTVLRILELRLIDKWGDVSTIKHRANWTELSIKRSWRC